MAGIALYGCLTGLMTTTGRVVLRHRLESVKILPPPPRYNEPPVYGRVMQDAVSLSQIQPWPKEVLEGLEGTPVSMRVTLSYFIEPSPNNVGWGKNHRYASHGLRFEVIRPLERLSAFKQRISKAEWDAPNVRPQAVEETREWVIGSNGRTHGTLHSDWWEGKAIDLARCNQIAVYPVTGWWKERHHLGRHDRKARYSLIVTIETPETDIYTPISQDVGIQTEITI